MHARVTTYENVDLALFDEVQRWMESLTENPFAGLPGYAGSMTLVDRDNARLVGIGFYESAGHASEAEAILARMPERAAEVPERIRPALATRPESIGLYEIAHRDD
jgi:hypothetical protein